MSNKGIARGLRGGSQKRALGRCPAGEGGQLLRVIQCPHPAAPHRPSVSSAVYSAYPTASNSNGLKSALVPSLCFGKGPLPNRAHAVGLADEERAKLARAEAMRL